MPSPVQFAALFLTVAIAMYGTTVGRPLLLPLTLALIFGALLHPLTTWLERGVGQTIAAVVASSIPTIIVVTATITGGYLAVDNHESIATSIRPMLENARDLAERARGAGLPLPEPGQGSFTDQLGQAAAAAGLGVTQVTTILLLTQFFLLLGLLERRGWRQKLSKHIDDERLQTVATDSTARIRSYFLTRTIACLLSGSVVAIFLAVVGVPGALLFGLLTAAFNYLPTLGAFVSAAPIIAVAIASQGPTMGAVTAGVLFVNEQVVSNVIDPLLQGERVGISPFVVLLSIIFWGILWGLPGAFVAIPLTLLMLSVAEQVPSLRPYASLLLREDVEPKDLA